MNDLNFKFDSKKPIYLQIYNSFISQMRNGYIKKGDNLPSVRNLAKQLNVSKSTIENAYDKLMSEGYIISKAKSGYYCDISEIKKTKNEMISTPNTLNTNYRYDFSSRLMDYEQFDQKVWIRYTKIVLENGTLMAGYGHPQGEYELREQLVNYLFETRNVHTATNNLLIGAGISPLLYFICSLFKKQTLKVGFISPGFSQAMSIFEDCRHQVILLDRLEDIDHTKLDILYLTPSTLNLTIKQRINLLKQLKSMNISLIEDDLNGDMIYQSTPLSSMQGLYDENSVFYISSFSKLLLPSVRLACLAIPNNFQISLDSYNQTASRIEQQVLAMYLQDGHMIRRIKRLRRLYHKKSKLMESILSSHFENYYLKESQLCFEIIDDFKHLTKDNHLNFQKINDTTIRLYFSGIAENQIEEGLYYLIKKWKSTNQD